MVSNGEEIVRYPTYRLFEDDEDERQVRQFHPELADVPLEYWPWPTRPNHAPNPTLCPVCALPLKTKIWGDSFTTLGYIDVYCPGEKGIRAALSRIPKHEWKITVGQGKRRKFEYPKAAAG
jgi:hypothetical protein